MLLNVVLVDSGPGHSLIPRPRKIRRPGDVAIVNQHVFKLLFKYSALHQQWPWLTACLYDPYYEFQDRVAMDDSLFYKEIKHRITPANGCRRLIGELSSLWYEICMIAIYTDSVKELLQSVYKNQHRISKYLFTRITGKPREPVHDL